MPFLKSFKKEDPRIREWRAAVEANKTDLLAAGRWIRKTGEMENELTSLLLEFRKDPENFELGERIVGLAAKVESERAIRLRLGQESAPAIHWRMKTRAVEAGQAALDAMVDGLIEELSTIKKREADEARRYGLDLSKASPLGEQVEAAIEKARSYRQSLPSCHEYTQVEGLVNEALQA